MIKIEYISNRCTIDEFEGKCITFNGNNVCLNTSQIILKETQRVIMVVPYLFFHE